MRRTKIFCNTLEEKPAKIDSLGHQYLIRAGYIRQLSNGIYTYLPLARKSLDKIQNIIREEMNKIGGQEILMPVINPADIWKKTGRWYQIGSELGRFKDRNNRDMVLAMTHEEVLADLISGEIQSYRQLPQLLYHFQIKWRDDPRPRAGLIRVREFTMKDSYSLDLDEAGLDAQYWTHYEAYFNIFQRCGLPVVAIEADTGVMGGQTSHEFMYLNSVGEDTIIQCESCDYIANQQVACFHKSHSDEEMLEVEKIPTPGFSTIDELCSFLEIQPIKTAKSVFFIAEYRSEKEITEQFIYAIIRGDMNLNETKLANAVGANYLKPATEQEIQEFGLVPGYASPVEIDWKKNSNSAQIVIDDSVPATPNLVMGANEEGFHYLNINYKRDYQANKIADIAIAQAGSPCPKCQSPLKAEKGIEVGNIFKLGTKYSEAMDCTYTDRNGMERSIVMGSYGIGLGRLLGSLAEEHCDENGLKLPCSVAPFQVYLIAIPDRGKRTNVLETAERIYNELMENGIEVLYDDRQENPGVKFNDADLIGIPIRVVISQSTLLQHSIEIKLRNGIKNRIVKIENAITKINKMIYSLCTE